jgi:hypothetical protein
MARFKDQLGLKFGRLTVVAQLADAKYPSGQSQKRWACKCECGGAATVTTPNLQSGNVLSCGCLVTEQCRKLAKSNVGRFTGSDNPNSKAAKVRHGANYIACSDPWYRRAYNIRCKAALEDIPFGFGSAQEFAMHLREIYTGVCPVFGTPMQLGAGASDNTCSVDRRIPELGYVRGNLQMMSFKANRVKNNATIAELVSLAAWVQKELLNGHRHH